MIKNDKERNKTEKKHTIQIETKMGKTIKQQNGKNDKEQLHLASSTVKQ